MAESQEVEARPNPEKPTASQPTSESVLSRSPVVQLAFLPNYMREAIARAAAENDVNERTLATLDPRAQWNRVTDVVSKASLEFVARRRPSTARKPKSVAKAKAKATESISVKTPVNDDSNSPPPAKRSKLACFFCQDADGDLIGCARDECARVYHETCLRSHPGATKEEESGKLTCPVHACALCGTSGTVESPLLECTECPIAYHELCLPAGCIRQERDSVICYRHYVTSARATKKRACKVFNINYCIECGDGGKLVCCDECPTAMHVDCIPEEFKPKENGGWTCEDCVRGLKPLPGDVVWAKYATCSWWPAVLVAVDDIPDGVKAANPKPVPGEVVVRFFASTYGWVSHNRILSFAEKDRILEIYFKDKKTSMKMREAVRLATEAHQKNESRHAKIVMESGVPMAFELIETNQPAEGLKLSDFFPDEEAEKSSSCSCGTRYPATDAAAAADAAADAADAPLPCGSKTDCINRVTCVECNDSICSAGSDRCQNRRIAERKYVEVEKFATEDARGFGLKTTEDIRRGRFVIEYVGELIDAKTCRQRIRESRRRGEMNFYHLTMGNSLIIDAGPKGNMARFINHSCSPNLDPEKWTVDGQTRVCLFANCFVPAGTELTFNYNLDSLNSNKTPCRCGSENCAGFIGGRKPKGEKVEKAKRSTTPAVAKTVEGQCFVCSRNDSALVECNGKRCRKAYHMACASLVEVPMKNWMCPRHTCDVCRKPAVHFCSTCPNSLCKRHGEGVDRFWSRTENGDFVCADHNLI